MPEPSSRISTPKIFMVAAAPSSLVPASVMSKGMIWSEYQGGGFFLEPRDLGELDGGLVDSGVDGDAGVTDDSRVEDGGMAEEFLSGQPELGPDVVDVGQEFALPPCGPG